MLLVIFSCGFYLFLAAISVDVAGVGGGRDTTG